MQSIHRGRSPGKSSVAIAAGRKPALQVWVAVSGTRPTRAGAQRVLEGYTGWASALAVLGGGRLVLCGGGDDAVGDDTVRMWDVAAGKQRQPPWRMRRSPALPLPAPDGSLPVVPTEGSTVGAGAKLNFATGAGK